MHIFFRLCTEPMGRYDPKINYQHTQECLKRLIYLYSVFPDHHDNRQEFESVYLLYNLGQSDALMHYYDLKKDIRWVLIMIDWFPPFICVTESS